MNTCNLAASARCSSAPSHLVLFLSSFSVLALSAFPCHLSPNPAPPPGSPCLGCSNLEVEPNIVTNNLKYLEAQADKVGPDGVAGAGQSAWGSVGAGVSHQGKG